MAIEYIYPEALPGLCEIGWKSCILLTFCSQENTIFFTTWEGRLRSPVLSTIKSLPDYQMPKKERKIKFKALISFSEIMCIVHPAAPQRYNHSQCWFLCRRDRMNTSCPHLWWDPPWGWNPRLCCYTWKYEILRTPLLSKSFEIEAHTYVLRVAPIFCHESLFAKYFIQSLLPPFVPHKVGFPSNKMLFS